MTASASSTSDQPAETPPASDANENPKPSDVASAPSTPSKSTSSSDTATPDDKPQVKQSEPKTPTPEQTKALFAGISKAVVKLDREPNRKTYTYDLMVLKTAQETLERLKINVLSEPQGNSTAVLTLSFDSDRVGTAVVFRLGAELMCTDSEFGEVIVWKQAEVLDPMSVNVLGPTPPNVLRSKVSAFYSALTKDYKNASTEP